LAQPGADQASRSRVGLVGTAQRTREDEAIAPCFEAPFYVKQRGGDHRVAQYVAPAGDRAVRRDDRRGLQVALGDDLEQRRGGLGGQVLSLSIINRVGPA
jgi:hypothetical protein